MSHDSLGELTARRGHLVHEMRTVLDAAGTELTAEDAQTLERIETDITKADQHIGMIQKANGLRDLPTVEESRSLALPEVAAMGNPDEAPVSEERSFEQFLRSRGEQRSNVKESVDANGGYLVPESWDAALISALAPSVPLLDLARTIQTASAAPYHQVVANLAQAFTKTNEEADISASADTFSEIVFGAYGYKNLVLVSNEVLQDSAYDINAEVRMGATVALNSAISTDLAKGNGTTAPQGVSNATVGVTTASPTALTADEFIDLQHALAPQYRASAQWLLADSVVKAARKLKDTNGAYIWQDGGYKAGDAATLLGAPVFIDPSLDAVAATKVVGVFGDFKRGYGIRRAGAVEVAVDTSRYFEKDQTAFRVKLRLDGKILDSNALVSLKMHA